MAPKQNKKRYSTGRSSSETQSRNVGSPLRPHTDTVASPSRSNGGKSVSSTSLASVSVDKSHASPRKAPRKNISPKKIRTKTVEIYSNGVRQKISRKLLKEIKYLQTSTFDCIPKLAFSRVVREVMQQYGQYRIESSALMGLQVAAEMYLVQIFEDSNKCTYHAKRRTLTPNDFNLVKDLRSRYEILS